MILTFKKLVLCLLITVFSVGVSFGQNDADPAITSFGFNSAAVPVGGTTTLSLFFLNNGDVQDLVPGSIAIAVSLTNGGEYLAEPEGPAAVVAGHPANMFTWTYNAATKTLRGVLNTPVTPGDGGQIDITVKGSVVGENSSTVNIQRLMPAFLLGDNVSNNTLPPAVLRVDPAMPVTLISFMVNKENSTANLAWSTSEETNSDKFIVQHSADAKNWLTIGEVKSHQNSNSLNEYKFPHHNTIHGANYYRLKMLDLDGTFSFSSIQKIEISTASISLFPNPATDEVSIDANLENISRVQIYAANGATVYDSGSRVTKTIDIRNLSTGLYVVRLSQLNGASETRKIAVSK